jgi:hypothetical protein
MRQDTNFILSFDVLIINWFARFSVYPTNMEGAIGKSAIEMLDETLNLGQLNASFNRELASSFHLPAGSRATPKVRLQRS